MFPPWRAGRGIKANDRRTQPMTTDALRHLARSLAGILEEGPRAKALAALDDPRNDPLVTLEDIGRHVRAQDAAQRKLLDERTFQLNLALDVLRNRDRLAAEQAE